MGEPLISVIVPIYNVEKYIYKCIDSILNQTYKNIEVILVDDESPDNCGRICDDYAKTNFNIKVIHKKNGGLSDARNAGLDIASGDFIGFVDSDDYISPEMYATLLKELINSNSDLAECAVERIYSDKIIKDDTGDVKILTGQEALEMHLKSDGNGYMPRTAVWSKLYKKDFFKTNRFPVGEIHEDYLLTCKSLYYANKVCLIDRCLYSHIYTNSSSITQADFSQKDLFKEKQYFNRMKFLKDKGLKKHYQYAKSKYYRLLLQFFYKCSFSGLENESNYYKKLIKNNAKDIMKTEENRKKRLEFRVFNISPRFYLLIRKRMTIKK